LHTRQTEQHCGNYWEAATATAKHLEAVSVTLSILNPKDLTMPGMYRKKNQSDTLAVLVRELQAQGFSLGEIAKGLNSANSSKGLEHWDTHRLKELLKATDPKPAPVLQTKRAAKSREIVEKIEAGRPGKPSIASYNPTPKRRRSSKQLGKK
jgi:SOS-response transcriptional repressor LexA